MSDMQGHMTPRERDELFLRLGTMTEAERKGITFALFVVGRGILDGQEAWEYLCHKYEVRSA